jgi:hypothetical protein
MYSFCGIPDNFSLQMGSIEEKFQNFTRWRRSRRKLAGFDDGEFHPKEENLLANFATSWQQSTNSIPKESPQRTKTTKKRQITMQASRTNSECSCCLPEASRIGTSP